MKRTVWTEGVWWRGCVQKISRWREAVKNISPGAKIVKYHFTRAPFDPSDPFDAMADQFRIQVSEMALSALKTTIYRDLSWDKQIESFLAGTMAGMIGVVFCHIKPEGRDEIMKYIESCLPVARQLVEEIEENPEQG